MNKSKLKKHFFVVFLLSLFFLISCNSEEKIMDENGNLVETYTLNKNRNKEGVYQMFDQDGNIIEKSNYQDGHLQGKHEFFYTTGELEQVEHYKNDTINGPCISYYKNGQEKLSYIYEMGVMNNFTKKYAENGVLLEVVQMKNNEENGPFKEYYENGKIKWEGQYLNGDNEFGILKNYNENGQLIKKMSCDSLAICRTIWTIEMGDIKLEPLNLKIDNRNE